MANVNLAKEVKIKTGIVKRYVKEYHYYEKEVQKHLEKINAMKEDPAIDEYQIKKFNEVIQKDYTAPFLLTMILEISKEETRGMIPITALNVKKSCSELKQLIEDNTVLIDAEQLILANSEISLAEQIQ